MPPATKAKTSNKGSAEKQVARIPFIQAAHPLSQPAFNFTSAALGAATQQFGPFDIPSGGFLRYIDLLVICSGGSVGSGALAADAPWNIIQSVSLSDVNGKNLIYPVIGGYELYLINRYGSFHYCGVPEDNPDADLTTVVATKFLLRIPVEIDVDGSGSLPNLNSAETYKCSITLNTAAAVFATAPTTAPVVSVFAQTHDWSLPSAEDGLRNAQETWPPMANDHSQTTQYHSMQSIVVQAGANTLKSGRMGNVLRNLILVSRTAAGARTADWPPDLQIMLDKYQLTKERVEIRHAEMASQFRQVGHAPPVGVFVYPFTFDGPDGFEGRHMWQPTMQPTELRFEGTWVGTAGKMQILTNDVAPGGE